MRLPSTLLLVLLPMTQFGHAACNVAGAVQLRSNLAELATWKESNGALEVTWNDYVLTQPLDKKRQLVAAFANADACITRHAREIRYFGRGKLMAMASPTSGISLVDPSTPAGGTGAAASPRLVVRGHAIEVGMRADDLFDIVKPAEMRSQDVEKDPAIPGSLKLTKHFRADGKSFTVTMARRTASGPYLVAAVGR